jgi:hypothetical protein
VVKSGQEAAHVSEGGCWPFLACVSHRQCRGFQQALCRSMSGVLVACRMSSFSSLVSLWCSSLGERATTLSSQTTGQRAGSVHLLEKLCSFFLLDIQNHSWRASGQEGPRGIGSGCEAHSARTRHNTTCIKQGYKTSARRLPLESLARGCSGSRFFCVPGRAVQGRSSRAPSPAHPSFDPDHALPFVLSPHFRHVDSPSTPGK